jgi:GH43 family beta-xylosidase
MYTENGKTKHSMILLIVILLFSFSNLFAQNTFNNPLITGQDPSVVYKDGFYYLIQIEGKVEGRFFLRKSKTVAGLKDAPKVEVWHQECCSVWAPELQFIRGKWYIYFTKDDGNNDNHRMYVLESKGKNPAGPYLSKGKIAAPGEDNWAIDGTVLTKDDGTIYFVWSGWEGKQNGQQNLYIAPMSNPYTISGKRVKIAQPTYNWEKNGMAINEGPQPIKKNGKYYIVYSASASWTEDYCLGMIKNVDGDLLNPSSWIKFDQPVFTKAEAAYGPGHHCMVEGPNGECWNIYHANEIPGSGWDGRSIRAQRFSWDKEDVPHFGTPIKSSVEEIIDSLNYQNKLKLGNEPKISAPID